MHVGTDTHTVKLTSGNLAVFSPVALTPSAQKRISALGNGKVAYIIAPDIEHHIFVSEWARAFPEAKIIGPEGLPEKRAKTRGDDRIGQETFDVVFRAATKRQTAISPEFDADFEYEFVDAHVNKELVFFYKPDRVMIEADLFFNLPPTEQYSRVVDEPKEGMLSKLFGRFQSAQYEPTKMRRFIWYLVSRSDRDGFNDSIRRMDAWDFNKVIPCHGDTIVPFHGDIIVANPKEVYRKVFAWHLKGTKS